MSDKETTPRPRRSQRETRLVERLGEGSPLKRKRSRDGSDEEENDEEILSEPEVDESYKMNKRPSKEVREKKTRLSPPKRPRRKKAVDVGRLATDTTIASDNPLFNAILNPATALQATVEDWLQAFSQSSAVALAELITCILRCCGCNDTVDEYQVLDTDGIVDRLDEFTESLRLQNAPTYPLVSKNALFKAFPKSLSEFLTRLINASDESGVLTPDANNSNPELIPILAAWLTPMSTSQIRSFRHTSTLIAMEIQTVLCGVAASIDSELEVITRQRDAEHRKSKKSSTVNIARQRELAKKLREIDERRKILNIYLDEFDASVFVNRYRDTDPLIRALCVMHLGKWLIIHSTYFLNDRRLRYAGWVLSDTSNVVRQSAVNALKAVYSKKEFGVALRHFTDRFKGRLIEMARRDTDTNIRVATIQLLSSDNMLQALDDEEDSDNLSRRDEMSLLVFDSEPRVRRAIAPFIKGVWEERVDDALVGQDREKETAERVGIKVLAGMMVGWIEMLSRQHKDGGSIEGAEEDSQSSQDMPLGGWPAPPDSENTSNSRTSVVVGALAEYIPAVSSWKPLLDDLLLDHSSISTGASKGKKRSDKRAGGKRAETEEDDNIVDEVWRLEDAEEGVLLEVLVASLIRVVTPKKGKEKDKDGASASSRDEITRALIKALPRLISKHQTDEKRIAEVLLIPQVMNLDLYLDMRMVSAYESIWDDVIKQFLTHSSSITLLHAAATFMIFMSATTLSQTNTAKFQELEDLLATSLRDAIQPSSSASSAHGNSQSHEDLEIATFTEDETRILSAIVARISVLIRMRDMTSWMEETESGKQSSAWDIFLAIVDRGLLSYESEEKLIVDATDLLVTHIIWKYGAFTNTAASDADASSTSAETARIDLVAKRDVLLAKISNYAIGQVAGVCESVKRACYHHVLSLYALFRVSAFKDLSCAINDEMQYRFTGFVQSEIERYAAELAELRGTERTAEISDESSDEETRPTQRNRGKASGKSARKSKPEKSKDKSIADGRVGGQIGTQTDGTQTQTLEKNVTSAKAAIFNKSYLEKEYALNALVSSFIRSIRVGIIAVRHCGILLAHYGRLDATFDVLVKTVVDILREEGMFSNRGETVVSVSLQALKESFALFLDGISSDESHTYALAKLLGNCFFVRGAQLAIVRRLEPLYIVQLHTSAISWAVQKIAGYYATKEMKMRAKALLFFRVLVPLLQSVHNHDLLQIRAHLEQAMEGARLEEASGKAWDAYRAYDKKLQGGGSKPKAKTTKQGGANGVLTTDDEQAAASQSDNDGVHEPPSHRRPKPRPIARRSPSETGRQILNMDTDPLEDLLRTPRDSPSASKADDISRTVRNGVITSQQEIEEALEEQQRSSFVEPEESQEAPREQSKVYDPNIPVFKSKRKRMNV